MGASDAVLLLCLIRSNQRQLNTPRSDSAEGNFSYVETVNSAGIEERAFKRKRSRRGGGEAVGVPSGWP